MDAVISFNKVSEGSILAHNKITRFISDCFGGDILDSKEKYLANMMKPYDRVFIVNGLECFCDYRNEMRQFLEFHKNSKLYWATNDYKLTPSKPIREIMEAGDTTLLSTVEESLHKQKFYRKYQYINWNSLTLNLSFDYKSVSKPGGLIYYGAFRKGREKYFEKYFAQDLYEVHISTTKTNVDDFLAIDQDQIRFYPPFKWTNVISELCSFKFSIYLEDEASHKAYCSPANRFYECLSNGVVMLFDKSCKGTFDKAGIDISSYIVDSPQELAAKMKEIELDFIKHADIQRSWVGDGHKVNKEILRNI